jgi:hypothetical protein
VLFAETRNGDRNQDGYAWYHATGLSTLLSTALQEGQTKISCSSRTPNFKIVRECFMVSPQQRHTKVGDPAGYRAALSTAEVDGGQCSIGDSLEQAGALPNSQPSTPGTRPLPMMNYM